MPTIYRMLYTIFNRITNIHLRTYTDLQDIADVNWCHEDWIKSFCDQMWLLKWRKQHSTFVIQSVVYWREMEIIFVAILPPSDTSEMLSESPSGDNRSDGCHCGTWLKGTLPFCIAGAKLALCCYTALEAGSDARVLGSPWGTVTRSTWSCSNTQTVEFCIRVCAMVNSSDGHMHNVCYPAQSYCGSAHHMRSQYLDCNKLFTCWQCIPWQRALLVDKLY